MRLVSGVGTAVWCVTAVCVCVTAVDVRMKSVLDSETEMDGWAMNGWNGRRTGRNGKKKTDQGWGI